MHPSEPNPAPIDTDELARQLWAIGDPVRLRLLRLLPTEPVCEDHSNVSCLAEKLGLSQPTISHHLRVLRQAGLIANRKMCRDCYYFIVDESAEQILESLRRALLRKEDG